MFRVQSAVISLLFKCVVLCLGCFPLSSIRSSFEIEVKFQTETSWYHILLTQSRCLSLSQDISNLIIQCIIIKYMVVLCIFQICSICKERGAMVGCLHKGCTQKYHYICAAEKGRFIFFHSNMTIVNNIFVLHVFTLNPYQ